MLSDGKLHSPSAAVLRSWKGTRQCGWRVPEMCSLLSSPQDLWAYRPASCRRWRRHLWARLHRLHVFYRQTITGIVLRHDWASGHSGCHTYCWGVWINDHMDSAGCTTLTWNCQLHRECPTVFPLYPFFHSESEFRRINTRLLIFKPLKESEQERGKFFFHSAGFGDGSSRPWGNVPCLNWNSKRACASLLGSTAVPHCLVLVECDLCYLSDYLYSIIFGMVLL